MNSSRASRRRTEKALRKIKIVPTDFKLTTASGLGTVLEIFDQSPLAKEFKKCLPERISHRSSGSYLLALMVIAGHIHGVEALSDLATIKDDPYLQKLFDDETAAVRTIGDFLRDFEAEHIEKLNLFLDRMSRTLFASLQELLNDEYKPERLIVDMDSTYHEHFGEKIEGVAWNYKKEWSLETQVAFNQLGFCHSVLLRPGNTKKPSEKQFKPLEPLFYPLHDQTITVTQCGRICSQTMKVSLSRAFAGQQVGIKEMEDGIWLVSFLDYDLGYFDDKSKKVEPVEDPFGMLKV